MSLFLIDYRFPRKGKQKIISYWIRLVGGVEKWKDRKLVGGWKYRKIEKI